MGDDKPKDVPRMKPDSAFYRARDESQDEADTEGHGRHFAQEPGSDAPGMKPEGAKREGDDAEGEDRQPGPDDAVRWSDLNLKQAIVRVRW